MSVVFLDPLNGVMVQGRRALGLERALGVEESPGMESYLFHQLDLLSKNQQVELQTSHLKL